MTRRIVHPRSGDAFLVPEDWEVLGEHDDADTLVAVEPGTDEAFRANLVLSVVTNGGMDDAAWQQATEAQLPRTLQDYQLLDLDTADVAGRTGGRRLARHVTPDGTAATLEQWFVSVDGVGHTVSLTVPDLRYGELSAVAVDAVAGWEIGTGADGGVA